VRLVHQIIERAIKHAQAADLVGRNVASLITAPEGRSGRPTRSLTLDQATAVLEAAQDSPLHAYVVLSLPPVRACQSLASHGRLTDYVDGTGLRCPHWRPGGS